MYLELPNLDWIAAQFPMISEMSAVSGVDICRSVSGYDGDCGVFRVSPVQTLALAIQVRAKCHDLDESTVVPSYALELRNEDMTRGNLPVITTGTLGGNAGSGHQFCMTANSALAIQDTTRSRPSRTPGRTICAECSPMIVSPPQS
jgi:hypothetical protein